MKNFIIQYIGSVYDISTVSLCYSITEDYIELRSNLNKNYQVLGVEPETNKLKYYSHKEFCMRIIKELKDNNISIDDIMAVRAGNLLKIVVKSDFADIYILRYIICVETNLFRKSGNFLNVYNKWFYVNRDDYSFHVDSTNFGNNTLSLVARLSGNVVEPSNLFCINLNLITYEINFVPIDSNITVRDLKNISIEDDNIIYDFRSINVCLENEIVEYIGRTKYTKLKLLVG